MPFKKLPDLCQVFPHETQSCIAIITNDAWSGCRNRRCLRTISPCNEPCRFILLVHPVLAHRFITFADYRPAFYSDDYAEGRSCHHFSDGCPLNPASQWLKCVSTKPAPHASGEWIQFFFACNQFLVDEISTWWVISPPALSHVGVFLNHLLSFEFKQNLLIFVFLNMIITIFPAAHAYCHNELHLSARWSQIWIARTVELADQHFFPVINSAVNSQYNTLNLSKRRYFINILSASGHCPAGDMSD